MSQPRPTDPIGSIGWTDRTGGVLTARECLTFDRGKAKTCATSAARCLLLRTLPQQRRGRLEAVPGR